VLQDNVKEQEHLKELFAEYANATKELDAAQSAVAPLAQKFDSQLKKKETLDALNSEITLKLQVRDQGYGLRRGKATEEQDKTPVIAKLMDELNKLKGKLQQLQCHTSPDSISHNCRSRSQQSCDV
jgi:ribosomal protein L16 Arg81 hydroxylase